MLYRQKFDTFIRVYDDCGYITSKSGYGDRVTDQAGGAVFPGALSRKPHTLEELCAEIGKAFIDADPETLKQDAREFYAL
jgi:hypothetical protein